MNDLPFSQKQKTPTYSTRICEICGNEFIEGYGYSICASWLVTGHAWVSAFDCAKATNGQHWGCTPEHAMLALATCLQHDSHMSVNQLKARHAEKEEQGKSRIALEDVPIAEQIGPTFPIIKKVAKAAGG